MNFKSSLLQAKR